MEEDLGAVEFCYLFSQLNRLLLQLAPFLLLRERAGLFYGVGLGLIGEMVALDALYFFADADDPPLLVSLRGLGLAHDVVLSLIFEVRQEMTAIDAALLFLL